VNRRALLGGPLLLARPRRKKGHRVTQPWSNQSVSLIEILATPGAFTGLFVFSSGRLIASVAPGGTEPSTGTPYNPGIETFDSLGRTLTMANNALTWSKLTDTPDIPPAINGFPSKATGNSIGLSTGEGNIASNPGALTLYDSAAASTLGLSLPSGTAATFVPLTAPLVSDVWQSFGSLAIGGWTVSSAKYKQLADSGLVAVRIQNLAPSTHPADGTTIWSSGNGLPAAYRPAITTRIACYSQNAGSETPALSFETDGSITVYGLGGTTSTRMDLHTTAIATF
jgi:hypothetical protein